MCKYVLPSLCFLFVLIAATPNAMAQGGQSCTVCFNLNALATKQTVVAHAPQGRAMQIVALRLTVAGLVTEQAVAKEGHRRLLPPNLPVGRISVFLLPRIQNATYIEASTDQILVDVKSLAPLDISNVRYDRAPRGIANFRYDLRNNGDKAIVAYEVMVEFSDGQNVSRSPQYSDYWASLDNPGIAAGASVSATRGMNVASKTTDVRMISLKVAAVGLADGTWVGPDAMDFHRYLLARHHAILEQYQTVRAAFEARGLAGANELLSQPSPFAETTFANAMLSDALKKGAPQGLRSEIARLTSTAP